MAVPQLSPADHAAFLARIERLRADSPRQFGTLTQAAMCAHLRQTIAISLGEVPFQDQSHWITRRRLFIVLVFRYMPWPKGKIKAPPMFFAEHVADFESERAALKTSIRQFLEAVSKNPQQLGHSPLLGGQPLALWQLIHGRHLDHHLRQFGA